MSTARHPPEPWHSFLRALDDAVEKEVRLDCIGGFVVTQLYGLERPTADLYVIELAPPQRLHGFDRTGRYSGDVILVINDENPAP